MFRGARCGGFFPLVISTSHCKDRPTPQVLHVQGPHIAYFVGGCDPHGYNRGLGHPRLDPLVEAPLQVRDAGQNGRLRSLAYRSLHVSHSLVLYGSHPITPGLLSLLVFSLTLLLLPHIFPFPISSALPSLLSSSLSCLLRIVYHSFCPSTSGSREETGIS